MEKKSDKRIGFVAGLTVLLKNNTDRYGLLVVGRGEKKDLAVYSGQIWIVTKDKFFAEFLKSQTISFNQIDDSYFLQKKDFKDAIVLLEDIKENFPKAVGDLDWLIYHHRPM